MNPRRLAKRIHDVGGDELCIHGIHIGIASATGLAFLHYLPPALLLVSSRVLLRWRLSHSPLHYTDWILKDWRELYSHEIPRCVCFSYQGKKVRLPEVLISDNCVSKLDISAFSLEYDGRPFKVPSDVRALTEKPFTKLSKKLKGWTNEENLRLLSIDGSRLSVQCVLYEDYLRTNLVLDARIGGQRRSLRQTLHSGGHLEDLGTSPLANNLGVNILIFTADGSMILQQRSSKVGFRRGEWCSSGSGTFSRRDVRDAELAKTAMRFDRVPILREAQEEIGVPTERSGEKELVFLGATRELIRGGQPELFFFTCSDFSWAEIQQFRAKAKDKNENKRLGFFSFGTELVKGPLSSPDSQHNFLSACDQFVDQFADLASIPLLTNFALWQRYRLNSDERQGHVR